MGQRGLNAVIALAWLSTMTWLVVAKVLPPLERGEPPNLQSLYNDLDPAEAPVRWDLLWNDRPIGWATSQAVRPFPNMLEIRSHVHFSRLPLEDMAPVWMRSVLQSAGTSLDHLRMDALNRFEIDSLGRLTSFRSSIHIDRVPAAIVVEGAIEGTHLKLRIDAGSMPYSPPEIDLPQDALLSDELSPQTRLPGLHLGQTWTMPVYNPLHPDSPVDMLQAMVEGTEQIAYDGGGVNTLLVVYRSDPGSESGSDRTPRAKLWVDSTGLVLRQETWLFGSRLTFARLSPNARRSAEALEEATELIRKSMLPRGRHHRGSAEFNERPSWND
jgi:hypothetical protein